ncbi:hypothetical protein METSCH_D08050 [Metschnikowia aff. pulcherrima]|uniref:GLEYA adhesin domain-containing protein n=1 Tax=Metschnikowia aff. pulcherrima TaxID=2163413 RepID=A0A4P6XUV5_9ASCO|nr:hypothetical protein METSCH_D08050 [Metschnikowia aff. pulcherrima]
MILLLLLQVFFKCACAIKSSEHQSWSHSPLWLYADHIQKRDETIPRTREQELSQHHVIELLGFFLPKYSGRHEFALEASTDASLQFGVSNRCIDSPSDAATRALAIRSSRKNSYSVLLQAGLYYPMKIVFIFPVRNPKVPVYMGFMFKEPHGEFREDITDYIYQADFGPTGFDKPEQTLMESALMPGCRALNQGQSGFEVNYRIAKISNYEELDDDFFIDGVNELEIVGSKLLEKKVNFNFKSKSQESGNLKEQNTEPEDAEAPLWYFKSMPAHHLKLHYDNEEEAHKPTYRPMRDNSQPSEGLLLGFEDPHLVYSIADEDMSETPIEYPSLLYRDLLEVEEGDPRLSYESFYAELADEMPQSDQPLGYHDYDDDGSILDFNGENSVDWDVEPEEFDFEKWDVKTTRFDEFPAPDELRLLPKTADKGELRGDQPPDEDILDGYHDDNRPPLSNLESLSLKQVGNSVQSLQNDAVVGNPMLEIEGLGFGNDNFSLSSPSVAKSGKLVISEQPSATNGAEKGIALQGTQKEATEKGKAVSSKENQGNVTLLLNIESSPQGDEHSTLHHNSLKTEPSYGQIDPILKNEAPLMKNAFALKRITGVKLRETMKATSHNEIVRPDPFDQSQRAPSHSMEGHSAEKIAVAHDSDEKVKYRRVILNATSNMQYSELNNSHENMKTKLEGLDKFDSQYDVGLKSQNFQSVQQGSTGNITLHLLGPKMLSKPEMAGLKEDASENHLNVSDIPASSKTLSRISFDLEPQFGTLYEDEGVLGENPIEDIEKIEYSSPKSFECKTAECSSLRLLKSTANMLEGQDIIHNQAQASLESQVEPQEPLSTTELLMSHDSTRNDILEDGVLDSTSDTSISSVHELLYDSLGSFVRLNPALLAIGLCLISLI